jgi:tRNA threonylcarbamoyladenosine biosynthesis protein TsaB
MILAIDSATRNIGLALYDGQNVIAEVMWHSENNHTIELAPNVKKILNAHNIQDLTGIGVAIGPGSFNGVRIGLAFAKGLALAKKIPLLGVRTLDIYVHDVELFDGNLIPVIQAGRGRIIWALYTVVGQRWESASAGEVSDWQTLIPHAADRDRIIGEVEGAPLDQNQIIAQPRRPAVLAQITYQRLARADTDDAATLAPIYANQPTSGTA